MRRGGPIVSRTPGSVRCEWVGQVRCERAFDGTISFYTRINALVNNDMVVLDVGCGRGSFSEEKNEFRKNLQNMRGKTKLEVGIDVDMRASENPGIDLFLKIDDSNRWQIETNSVDMVICDNVIEHIECPEFYFSELERVLKSGGYFCARTPNKWGYVSFVSRFIPIRLKDRLLKMGQPQRKDEDTFPTFYRCNSVKSVKKVLRKYNMISVVYGFESEPRYFDFSFGLFYLGYLFQKFAPNCVRPSLFIFARKA